MFYSLHGKKVLKRIQVATAGGVRAKDMQMISEAGEYEDMLMISYEDGSEAFVDLVRESVVARFEGRGSARIVGQIWPESVTAQKQFIQLSDDPKPVFERY